MILVPFLKPFLWDYCIVSIQKSKLTAIKGILLVILECRYLYVCECMCAPAVSLLM